MKKVSIIVPVYNVEEYLEECLESLVNQTLEEIEVIAVNDGTPDNSQAIIDRYVSKYPEKVIGYIKPNGGVSDARNFGMARANGEYIGFVDSDDYIDVTMYEKLYNAAAAEDADVAICGYFNINEITDSLVSKQIGNSRYYGCAAIDNKEMIRNTYPLVVNKIIRKKLIEDIHMQFPQGLYYEDIATLYPIIASANKVVKVEEELYFYRAQRAGSTTNTYTERRVMTFDALALLCERFKELNLFEEFYEELKILTLRYTYYRFVEFYKYKNEKLQSRMVDAGFSNLNKYFPGWRDEIDDVSLLILNNNVPDYIELYKQEKYWKGIAGKSLKERNKIESEINNRKDPSTEFKQYYSSCLDTESVVKKTVLVESCDGTVMSDEILEIMRKLSESGRYEIYCSTDSDYHDNNRCILESNELKVQLVNRNSRDYYKLLTTARYLINNHTFPLCYLRRKGQTYIYIWNGTPQETAGRNVRRGIASISNLQHNLLQSKYLIFSDEKTEEAVVKNYDLQNLFTGKSIVSEGSVSDYADYIFEGKESENLKVTDYAFNRSIIRTIVIQEKNITDKAEYDRFINDNNGENVVFAIRTKFFNQLVNKWFYEEYNEKVTYIVYNHCNLISARNEKLWQKNDDSLFSKLYEKKKKLLIKETKKRGYQRSLPHLKFSNKYKVKQII